MYAILLQVKLPFFGQPAMLGNKMKSCNALPVKGTLLDLCQERKSSCAHTIIFLHAAEAVYHKNSDSNFSTKKQIPTAHNNDK